jgi:mitochondrial chaperone BCS1
LGLNICLISLTGGEIDDNTLNHRLNDAPERSIILIEDIDSIFLNRDTVVVDSSEGKKVTFAGLLNAMGFFSLF